MTLLGKLFAHLDQPRPAHDLEALIAWHARDAAACRAREFERQVSEVAGRAAA